MEQQIISNKVYESLQVPTESTRTTTGKVLYANKYSGVAEVAMPEDLKALIDSDFGLVGKNVLVQLEQKMKGYTNGPWYVDSRDGVIYIHNRKFHEEPDVEHFGRRGTGMMIVPGMTFTIEPMINMGTYEVFVDEADGWTVCTDDGLPSAQWENMILITETGNEILTY